MVMWWSDDYLVEVQWCSGSEIEKLKLEKWFIQFKNITIF
jgi:hypothetical protein